MAVGLYYHNYQGAFAHVAQDLRDLQSKKGAKIPLIEHNFCLCSSKLSIVKLEEDVLLHPGDSYFCHRAVKKVIVASPNTTFFILAQGVLERMQRIGEHGNVKYVGGGCEIDFRQVIDKLTKKYLGATLHELHNQFLLKPRG